MHKKILKNFCWIPLIGLIAITSFSCGSNSEQITKYDSLKLGEGYNINSRNEAEWLINEFLAQNQADYYSLPTINTADLTTTALVGSSTSIPKLKFATLIWNELIWTLAHDVKNNNKDVKYELKYSQPIQNQAWVDYIYASFNTSTKRVNTTNVTIDGISGIIDFYYSADSNGKILFNVGAVSYFSRYYFGAIAI
jgi:hypothetical protein